MILCPKCGGKKTHIFDNAFNPETNESYRKRRCTECSHVFFTVEFEVEATDPLKADFWKHHRLTAVREQKNKAGRNRCEGCENREHMGGPCCEGCEALSARKNTINKLSNKE